MSTIAHHNVVQSAVAQRDVIAINAIAHTMMSAALKAGRPHLISITTTRRDVHVCRSIYGLSMKPSLRTLVHAN